MGNNKILDVITRISTNNLNCVLNLEDDVIVNNTSGYIEHIGAEEIAINSEGKIVVFKIKDIVSLRIL
ncbi:hypothetical protein ETU08_00275 [Apibacter muscae]|uniref:hypothetical protein n=1 Tax=Apibacter muscae TaxID=2509004 RepID=UPI0011AD589E|nr:hypothetical protein [Apibacter muscae]TWP31806.1 hypothetical protein ETU08_00275 [Apibacter muscae]